MRAEQILRGRNAVPFRPFVLRMGPREYPVPHPDYLLRHPVDAGLIIHIAADGTLVLLDAASVEALAFETTPRG